MTRRIRHALAALALLALGAPALGQVRQSGTVTPGHAAYWSSSGVIADGGTAASGNLTSLGVTNNGGPGICVNSAVNTAPYNAICLSTTTNGNGVLTVQNYNGAIAGSLSFLVNGTVIDIASVNVTIGTTSITGGATGRVLYDNNGVFGEYTQTGLTAQINLATSSLSGAVPSFPNTTSSFLRGDLTYATLNCGALAGASAMCSTTDAASLTGTLANARLSGSYTGITTLGTVTGGTLNGLTVTGLASPTNASDAANKSYVDSVGTGIRNIGPSRLATAAVLPNTPTYSNGASGVGATLTAGSNTTLTVDGTVAALNDVVLVKTQASAFQNGQYYVSAAGSGAAPWVLTRCASGAGNCSTEFDSAATMLAGSYSFITAGSTLAGTAYNLSNTVTTVGTTAATFVLFSSPAAGVSSFGSQTGVLLCGSALDCSTTTINVKAASVTNAMLAGSIDLPTKATGILLAASMPALTGDVTTSAGAVATTIAGGVVDNTKLASMTSGTVKCRLNIGAGQPADCGTLPGTVQGNITSLGTTQGLVCSDNSGNLSVAQKTAWTPTITASVPGNLSVSYASRVGWYTRCGKILTVTMDVSTSSFTWTTASGQFVINGLPVAADGDYTGVIDGQGFTKAGHTSFVCVTSNTSTAVVVEATGSGVGISSMLISDFPSGGTVLIRCQFTYFTA